VKLSLELPQTSIVLRQYFLQVIWGTKVPFHTCYFHIISKDTGFDPLIKHLKARKIRIQRERDLAEIPVLRMSNATSSDEKVSAIVKNLAGRGQARPRKVKTLANTINSLFAEKLEEKELMNRPIPLTGLTTRSCVLELS